MLVLSVATAGLLIAGCGSSSAGAGSSSEARRLLSETFTGKHTINRGRLSASITITPTGSADFTQPVSLDFSGPFQSASKGQLPESDFNIAIHFEGTTGQLSFLSTGTAGYVIVDTTAYKLPAASFKKLESGLGGTSNSSSRASSSVGGLSLSHLGIHPEEWLADPEVLGTVELGGTRTEHIRGTLALAPLLRDLSKILAKASTLSSASTVTSAAGDTLKAFSPATEAKIEGEVKHATFNLWTGASDHTIRKLDISATLPVSGKLRTQLGGLTSAAIAVQFGYSHVGQTQTITAPATTQPYSQFETKITEIFEEIEELAEADANSGSTASG